MAFERRARNRHERHDERIDAKPDKALAHREDRFLGVAEAGEDVGRKLAAAEHRHGGFISREIAFERFLRLYRHDATSLLGRHRLEMLTLRRDATRLIAPDTHC